MQRILFTAGVGLALASLAFAQAPQHDGIGGAPAASEPSTQGVGDIVPGRRPGTERWIAHFATRSFDLGAFREAILAGKPPSEVDRIVADMQRSVVADQAQFVEAVERLGGEVVLQWWLVNAAAFEIAPAQLDRVRALPNVLRLEADRWVSPAIKTATNASNHNSDAVNAGGFLGLGVCSAIMDTGQDSNMGGSGRPHRMYFVNGDPNNNTGGGIGGSRLVVNKQIGLQPADDVHGHGTGVASIVGSGGWLSAGADAGHAPRAQLAGYAIADNTGGGSSFTTITTAWQTIAADKAQLGIVSANNSYSGSPDPLNVSQQALDSAAYNADIMVCVSGGNSSSSTSSSQSCANGLAVAAVNPNSHTMATFSSRGPLSGDIQRFYPDISGCGVSTVMARRDAESSDYVASGTSMASPQVCGAATLIRAFDPTMKADETKAVLLATTKDISAANPNPPYNSRNAYGMGLLRDDYAMSVTQRARGDHGRGRVDTNNRTWTKTYTLTPGRTYQVAIAWQRSDMTTTQWANLDLEVKEGSTSLGTSTTPRNLYEKVVFVPTAASVTIYVTATAFQQGASSQDFGFALFDEGFGPVPGDYTVYGAACRGSGQGGGGPACLSSNANATATRGLTGGAGSFGFPATATQNITVTGFEIFARSSSSVTLNTELYLADASGRPTGSAVRTGTMVVGSTDGWYTTTFAPYNVGSGTNIAITFQNAGIILNIASTGTNATHYYRPPGATSWNGPFTSYPWAWKINCGSGGGGALPVLGNTGVPLVGSSFDVNLSFARANTPVVLFTGASDTNWLGIPLPFDLGLIGAPTCSLLASGELQLPGVTDANGLTKQTLNVPNAAFLVGTFFFNQWIIVDPPTNNLQLVTSNGGKGKIGRP